MKSTKSLCPECLAVIDASILEENGKIILEKTCKKHLPLAISMNLQLSR